MWWTQTGGDISIAKIVHKQHLFTQYHKKDILPYRDYISDFLILPIKSNDHQICDVDWIHASAFPNWVVFRRCFGNWWWKNGFKQTKSLFHVQVLMGMMIRWVGLWMSLIETQFHLYLLYSDRYFPPCLHILGWRFVYIAPSKHDSSEFDPMFRPFAKICAVKSDETEKKDFHVSNFTLWIHWFHDARGKKKQKQKENVRWGTSFWRRAIRWIQEIENRLGEGTDWKIRWGDEDGAKSAQNTPSGLNSPFLIKSTMAWSISARRAH